jgi:hypothetical protein
VFHAFEGRTLRAKLQHVERYLFDATDGCFGWLKSTIFGGSQPRAVIFAWPASADV